MSATSLFNRILHRFPRKKAIGSACVAGPVDVCVIDAARSDCDLMRLIFETRGWCCAVSHDGRAGLDLIRARRPRLVLLDVPLPHRNGYELIQAIRADPELAATKILLLTALTKAIPDPARDWAALAGADAYLPKPIDAAALLEKARVLLTTEDSDRPHLLSQ
ncbi:MAG: response regulator [Sumerlaeia bacterium]